MTNTTDDPWAAAKKEPVLRGCGIYPTAEIDRGVNFFVLKLEQLGAKPQYSCEGHPGGFYVLFAATYALAQKIQACGYFSVEIAGKNRWLMRTHVNDEKTKTRVLSSAARQWERFLGPLETKTDRRKRRRVCSKH